MSNTNIPKFASDLKILLSQQDQSIDKNDRIIGATKVYNYIYNNIEDYMNNINNDINKGVSYQKLLITVIDRIRYNEIENENLSVVDKNIRNKLTLTMDKCKPILKSLFIQYVLNSPELNNYDDIYKSMYSKCVSYFELNDSMLRSSSRRKQLKYPNFIGMDDDNYDEENVDEGEVITNNTNKNNINKNNKKNIYLDSDSDSDSDYEDKQEKMKEKKLWSIYKRLNKGVTTEHIKSIKEYIKIIKEQRKQMALLEADQIVLARRSSRLVNKPKKNYLESDDEI